MPETTLPYILIIVALVMILASFIIMWALCYKRCPPDKILVIYGKVGKDKDGKERTMVCRHGGAAFIVPVVQSYAFLDLSAMRIAISVTEKERRLAGSFTVKISTAEGLMQAAAERFLNVPNKEIAYIAEDIIKASARTLLPDAEEKDKFIEALFKETEKKLNLLGLTVISISIDEFI